MKSPPVDMDSGFIEKSESGWEGNNSGLRQVGV